jgi:SAM-dependent methyltransferase
MTQSDVEWEKIGRSEPYWGVLTQEKYKKENLTPELRQEFFDSGERYVEQIFKVISSHFDRNFCPLLGIDFGCGVGRIVIPLAKRCKKVIGVDVSPSMIEEAKRNCAFFNIKNVDFADDLSKIEHQADFINTALVLQHIETKRGMNLIEDLIRKLRPSGLFVFQVPYAFKMSPIRSALSLIFRSFVHKSSLAQKLYNLIVKRDATSPFLLMNEYDINTILTMLLQKELNKVLILTEKYDTKTARVFSALLFVKK